MPYWRRVVNRAWADTVRVAEPHKALYSVLTSLAGLLNAWMILGVKQPSDWWKVGLVGAVGGVLACTLAVYVGQFLAAPARLDHEREAEVAAYRWQRGETYGLMAELLEEFTQLGLAQRDALYDASPWEQAYDGVLHRMHAELRPRIRDHEFHALIKPPDPANQRAVSVGTLVGVKYLLLPIFRRRLVRLMERYQ